MLTIEFNKYMKATEPWLYNMNPINTELEEEVKGFVNFLDQKMSESTIYTSDKHQIMKKRAELTRWRSVIDLIRPMRMYGENFIDNFHIPSEPFRLSHFNGQVVLSLLNTVRETNYAGTSARCQISVGFLLKKCLRQVQTKTEAREIYRATRCEVDLTRKVVLREFQEEYIIKRVAKSTSSQLTRTLKREFKTHFLLSKLGHRGINVMTSYCEDEGSMYSISVSAGKRDLLDALQDEIDSTGKTFSEQRIRSMFRPALEGLLVAHNLGIAHRDVSLENLCLNDSDKLELIDWGHSCSTNGKYVKYKGAIGKARYFAPELLKDLTIHYDPYKADVFSLGVCLFSAFTGQMPFSKHGDTRSSILSKGCDRLLRVLNSHGKKLSLSPAAVDLLNGCLKWNVNERLSLKEVLDHEFFQL